MNIEQAKQIRLQDYMQNIGHDPVKIRGEKLYYKSPFRNETSASFNVNTQLNLWYDFGLGKGGNIISLAECIYNSTDVSYLLSQIARDMAAFMPNEIRRINHTSEVGKTVEASFKIVKVQQLTHPALLRYLLERKIDITVARKECVELHFINNSKQYFAIGFPNKDSGYELRNSLFKGCIAPKTFTLIRAEENAKACIIFEGFMDYLSYLTLCNQGQNPLYISDSNLSETYDYMILNSVTNLQKAKSLLDGYDSIVCLFDNDMAGRESCAELKVEFGNKVVDSSFAYAGYKDVNEMLCSTVLSTV